LAKAVAELEQPETAPAAIKSLHNTEPNPKRHAEVARLLEKWAGQTDYKPMARADAATALRWWGTPESVKALAALVADESEHSGHFRQPALWSLAYLGGEKAAAAIATRIDDAFDRSAVVKILQGMGSEAEPQAIALLESNSTDNRIAAAKILKTIGTKTAAPALFKAAERDQNESVRKDARTALQTIAARQSGVRSQESGVRRQELRDKNGPDS
jgi:HEAT repeat protein